jgi:hypothetical protein
MLAFSERVGPDLFSYAPICPEVGAATPDGYQWSGTIALGECRGLRGTKKTELIESNCSVESSWSAFVSPIALREWAKESN